MSLAAKGVTHRMFIGCRVTAELRFQLDQNSSWTLDDQEPKLAMKQVDGTDYFGFMSDSDCLQKEQLEKAVDSIQQRLERFFPEFDVDSLEFHALAQLLLN